MTAPLVLHFLDTEDTDLDETPEQAAKVEIIEYAVVRWTDGNAQPLCHEYVMPRQRACAPKAKAVNGFTVEAWAERKAHVFADVNACQLTEALENAFIAGSNPDFDKRMVQRECLRMAKPAPKWSHRSLNTASLGMPLWMLGEVQSCGLQALGAYFGCEAEQSHTALGDCYRAITVWEGLYDLYVYKPKVMREGLLEIANDPETDEALRSFAGMLAEGRTE